MAFISSRTTALSPKEIAEFISNHLPYRIKILDKVASYPNQINSDPLWPSIYESAQITCRMFIQFFGLGVNGNDNPKLQEYSNYFSKDGIVSHEVKIKDLGFNFIRLVDLTLQEQELLAHAYESGNRATAHLTFNTPFIPDPGKVIEATKIVRNIIRKELGL
jgi:hypothetical protein